ncbi:hypothetical protein [Andreprevotia chitinilytica]|uniref:hypothetical protein n=1 Tax=Andreprevotia chitinilytica TaxID=396808 RepID=UPI00055280BD|nr:hypothetical protein [Andreprevotia chitinilytica]
MLIKNTGLDAATGSMNQILEQGHLIAGRIQRFSESANVVANATQVDHENAAGESASANNELSAEIASLAEGVARFSVLGRLASLQLGMYSIVATDGK